MRKHQFSFILALFLFLTSSCQALDVNLPGFAFANFKNTPCWELAQAVHNNDSAKVQKLAILGNPVNCFDPKFGNSLLLLAMINNKPAAFTALLEAGIDVNACSPKDSSTALFTLCAYSDVTKNTLFYMERLVQHGADVNASVPDSLENKPILLTCLEKLVWTSRKTAEIAYLMDHGVVIDRYPRNGDRAIVSVAAILEHFLVLRYLLIDRKMAIPDYCVIQGEGTKQEIRRSLREIVNASTSHFYDPQEKQAKEDVLTFLTKSGF